MTNERIIKRIELSRKIWLFVVTLFGFFGVVVFIRVWLKCTEICDWKMEDLATSISGTTGVLWSAAGIILVFVVYLGQKIEIIQQRIELEENRIQLKSQAESMKKQNEIAIASQDYHITKELIEEFCIYLSQTRSNFSVKELLLAIQEDTMKYMRETGSHEDKYLEYLLKFYLAEEKRKITLHVKFSLAAILHKFNHGSLENQEKSILISKLFREFSPCYYSGLATINLLFHLSRLNGNHPRFSHPDFASLETLFLIMHKFDDLQREHIPKLFD
jgi:hypothetical protein